MTSARAVVPLARQQVEGRALAAVEAGAEVRRHGEDEIDLLALQRRAVDRAAASRLGRGIGRVEEADGEAVGLLRRVEVVRREARVAVVAGEQRRVVVAADEVVEVGAGGGAGDEVDAAAGVDRGGGEPGGGLRGRGRRRGASAGRLSAPTTPTVHLRPAEAERELQQAEAEDRVEQQRQDDDHEDGAPVAELVAQLAGPDEADDRPAHTRGRLRGLGTGGHHSSSTRAGGGLSGTVLAG